MLDPISAVTHPDPYPYYAQLVCENPFHRDEALGVWVATSAEAVTAVLTHPASRVRPVSEPVPKALIGTAAGDFFSGLARMNDGDVHRAKKASLLEIVAALDVQMKALPQNLADVSVHALGTAFGVADDKLPELARLVGDFVRCIFPGGSPEQFARGMAAAAPLRALVPDPAIALMIQAYDATAGLIASALVHSPMSVEDVLRLDSPIQNTRRFFAERAEIMGQVVEADDVVLVVLAAANRDPAGDNTLFTFGLGAHACAGKELAVAIASPAVSRLLAGGRRYECRGYRPSPFARIPIVEVAR